jgi:hypothetical protein
VVLGDIIFDQPLVFHIEEERLPGIQEAFPFLLIRLSNLPPALVQAPPVHYIILLLLLEHLIQELQALRVLSFHLQVQVADLPLQSLHLPPWYTRRRYRVE